MKFADFRSWQILLQKSVKTDDVVRPVHLRRRVWSRGPDAFYATPTLYAELHQEHEWAAVARPAMRAAAGVLGDGSQNKLILGTSPDHAVGADSSFRMRFKCCEHASLIFLRSCRDCSKPSVAS